MRTRSRIPYWNPKTCKYHINIERVEVYRIRGTFTIEEIRKLGRDLNRRHHTNIDHTADDHALAEAVLDALCSFGRDDAGGRREGDPGVEYLGAEFY